MVLPRAPALSMKSRPDAAPPVIRVNGDEQQLFLVENAAREHEPGGGRSFSGLFAVRTREQVVGVRHEQCIAHLLPVPGFAVGRIEGCFHDRHDAVDIVGHLSDHPAAPGSFASGARP